MFLRSQLGEHLKELITVDILPEIIKIAKEYFGFVEDEQVKSEIADAYEYVNKGTQNKFDLIFVDINYEEAELELSPPMKFLETSWLTKLLDMTTKDGLVTFNLLCKDKEI